MKYYLQQRIGEPVLMLAPAAHATDIAASDNTAGLQLKDAEGVMFVLVGGVLTGDSVTVSIQYASDGLASNAASSNAGWTCTDCAFVAMDSDQDNSFAILDLDVNAKGIDDYDGKFYVASQAVGDGIYGVIGIPYNVKRTPTTNAIDPILR